MIPDMSQLRTTGDAQTVAVKNKVLKNTYLSNTEPAFCQRITVILWSI